MVIEQFNYFKNFFKTINAGPIDEICLGFVLGMFVGLIPFSINSFIITLVLFVMKTDKFTGVLAAALFGIISFMTDPIAHVIGSFVLVKVKFLLPIWTAFYNMPLVPFTRFNNTVVMGNSVLCLVLAIPAYMLIKKSVLAYRSNSKLKEMTEKFFNNKYLNNFNKLFSLFDKAKNLTSPGA